MAKLDDYWFGLVPAWPLAAFRILFAVALLCYFTDRIVHLEEFLGDSPGRLPDLGVTGDSPLRFHQPLYVEPLTGPMRLAVAVVFYVLGISLLVGLRARLASGLLAGWVASVTLADWIGAFAFNRSSVVILAMMAAMPLGATWSVDAYRGWRRLRAEGEPLANSPPLTEEVQISVLAGENTAAVPSPLVRARRARQAQGALVAIQRQRRPVVSAPGVVSKRAVLVGDYPYSQVFFRSSRSGDPILRVARAVVVVAAPVETLGHDGGGLYARHDCRIDDQALGLQR